MDPELIAYLDEHFRETSRQIEGLREETNRRFDRVEESIRHTRVEVEDLRGQIKLVAEGVVSTQETLAAFREETAKELREVRAEQSRNYSNLDRRVVALEVQARR